MAGVTGMRSRGRSRLKAARRPPTVLALLASTRIWLKRREWRIGMSESDSTPPARMVSACPQHDLVGGAGDGLRGGRARPVERVRRDTGRQLRQQADLPRDVGDEHGGHDLAEDDLVDLLAVDLGAVEQFLGGVAGELDGGDVLQDGAALRERGSHPGHDGDPAARYHCTRRATMLATARQRSASTGSSTSRPCSTSSGRTSWASSPGSSRWSPLSRAPPELALGLEKGFHDQDAARRHARHDVGHPGSVEIIEEEDDVELAEVGPGGSRDRLRRSSTERPGDAASSRAVASFSESRSTPSTVAPSAAAASCGAPRRMPGPAPAPPDG